MFDIEHAVTNGVSLNTVVSVMTDRSTSRFVLAFCLLNLAALGVGGTILWRQSAQLEQMAANSAANDTALDSILAEVTRIRIEQRADLKGPEGLLAKLRAYSPMLTSSRVTAPDYAAAKDEMDAILRAFTTMGDVAWPFVRGRIAELKPENYDELRWLLEVAVLIDEKAGVELLKQVLQGQLLPSPRLRWQAATLLLKHNKPLAQQLLRQILETESSRGVNLERAAAYNLPIPDQAATSTTGFFNFVIHYIRSEDPKIEDTLLLVLGRTEHDVPTLQECIEELGRRKCERAVEPIQRLYRNPPARIENPLFLTKCLDALVSIQGAAARPFLEEALRTASTEKVAQHINTLLSR